MILADYLNSPKEREALVQEIPKIGRLSAPSRWRHEKIKSDTTSRGRTMDEEEKQLVRAQMEFEHWLRIKQRISDGLCIACGGESDLRLYINFCSNCLREAGVKIDFVEPEEVEGSSSPKEANTSQPISSDKREQMFDTLTDSLDSLKSGQMEIIRLIEHDKRPAAAYERHIAAQLGELLYSRLHQTTQRALQLVEYLYNINREPDGFAPLAEGMAYAYINELTIRVIWPFVYELQAAGTQTYDAQGKSKEPLIRWGKVRKRSMTLGSLAWYLGNDPVMQSKVSERGFDPEAISKDAVWVNEIRNEAAHEWVKDRRLADKLRGRILRPDDILSRLHPMLQLPPTH